MAKKGEAYYRYSYEELSAFCLQISLLLEAAVPLEEGLAIMAEDAASQGEKDMLLYMAEGVEPVSYTHLDVYKRQHNENRTRIRCSQISTRPGPNLRRRQYPCLLYTSRCV